MYVLFVSILSVFFIDFGFAVVNLTSDACSSRFLFRRRSRSPRSDGVKVSALKSILSRFFSMQGAPTHSDEFSFVVLFMRQELLSFQQPIFFQIVILSFQNVHGLSQCP